MEESYLHNLVGKVSNILKVSGDIPKFINRAIEFSLLLNEP